MSLVDVYQYLVLHHVPKQIHFNSNKKIIKLLKFDDQHNIFHPISFEEYDLKLEESVDNIYP